MAVFAAATAAFLILLAYFASGSRRRRLLDVAFDESKKAAFNYLALGKPGEGDTPGLLDLLQELSTDEPDKETPHA